MIPVFGLDLPFSTRKEREGGRVMQLSAQPNKGLNILEVDYTPWKKLRRRRQAHL